MRLLLILLFIVNISFANEDVRYRAFFGKCPGKVAGGLALRLFETFEKNKSLREVKTQILKEGLTEKHFISEYKIKYDPLKDMLQFYFDCPTPLMKVQVYKKSEAEPYDAILVSSGELYDPTYELLLRQDGKLNHDLPSLALPLGEMNKKIQKEITKLMIDIDQNYRKKLSEVILGEDGELTMVLALSGHPTSVFLGSGDWEAKMLKLYRIIDYMENKEKIPAIINLTNAKKVVVKFSDKN